MPHSYPAAPAAAGHCCGGHPTTPTTPPPPLSGPAIVRNCIFSKSLLALFAFRRARRGTPRFVCPTTASPAVLSARHWWVRGGVFYRTRAGKKKIKIQQKYNKNTTKIQQKYNNKNTTKIKERNKTRNKTQEQGTNPCRQSPCTTETEKGRETHLLRTTLRTPRVSSKTEAISCSHCAHSRCHTLFRTRATKRHLWKKKKYFCVEKINARKQPKSRLNLRLYVLHVLRERLTRVPVPAERYISPAG